MDLLRSLLFVPADRERMLEKAGASGADAVVLDLEDAVPPAGKKAARRLARTWIARIAAAGPRVFVRINAGGDITRDDVLAVVRKGLAGIVLPKVEHPQDLRDLDVHLREAELAAGIRPGDIRSIPLIETPLGLLRAEDIARATDRLIALSVGGEDFAAALGVPRSNAALAHLRATVVTVAAAYRLPAIDTPWTALGDARGLAAETKQARALGFAGKYAIHPSHVAAINRAFSPSRDELAAARRIVDGADAARTQRRGSVAIDGRMVDAPIIQRARALLLSADAIQSRRTK
ncbi:MAG: CoA ester lyase [Chloroflexi bacterium]|nr:CoA ester lyase [Chloroflexota bacterium]